MPALGGRGAADLALRAAPFVFAVTWSTGFIGTRLGTAHAEPFTLLAWRYLFCLILMTAIVLLWRAPWPRGRRIGHAVVAGILMHGFYLGGIFWAIANGTSAGVAALIAGMHPLVTGLLAGLVLGETPGRRRWAGLVLGFAGLALVVGSEFGRAAPSLAGVLACLLAVVGIAAGSIWQKRVGGDSDLRASQAIQFASAALMMAILSWSFETGEVNWNTEFVLTLAWLVVVLSIGAVTLFYWLNRRGEVVRLASYFYLIPPCTAIEAHLVFGETLGWPALAGMAICVGGVALATREEPAPVR